jgi:hypothetical protein
MDIIVLPFRTVVLFAAADGVPKGKVARLRPGLGLGSP